MAKEFALDIFQLLGSIDKNDVSLYSKLSDEQKKGYTPLITMRWTTGTSDTKQILYVNELVNRYVFHLGKHPELLYKLQCAASSKQPKRYGWLAAKNTTKKIKGLDVVMDYHSFGPREAKAAMKHFGAEDILGMAEELGYQKEELAKLKKDLK